MHFPRLHRWLKLKTSALASVFRDRLFHLCAGVPKGCHRCWWCWAMPVPQRLGVQEEEETDLLRGRWRRSKQSISRATKTTRDFRKKNHPTMKIDAGKNLPKLKFLLWLYDWIAYFINSRMFVFFMSSLNIESGCLPNKISMKLLWIPNISSKDVQLFGCFFWGHGF